jgi:hypothetical protein
MKLQGGSIGGGGRLCGAGVAGIIGVRYICGGGDAKIEVEGAHMEEGEVAHVGGEVATQCSCLQI